MIIAKQKRKENIAEYLLYLWQVEDMIRAAKFDIETINSAIIERCDTDNETKAEMRDWYESLIKMMELEHIKEGGHLQICKNVLIRLTDLHLQLLQSDKFPEYTAEFYRTLPFIVELRAKSNDTDRAGELETCFNALYGVLMLRLQGKAVTPGTEQAIQQISRFIGMLAAYFKKDELKPLFDNQEIETT
ncbi:MAG: DUF4924 family protein [Muribaculaceae bacterium]|nr:DUF4924 family protein [Muribaculaceae bacterium]